MEPAVPGESCPVCGASIGAVQAQPAPQPPSPSVVPSAPPPAAPAPAPPPAAPTPMPPPRPEWVIGAAIGATLAILLAAVVAWRLADTSLLPTVESLGGPDNVDSVVPIPPPAPEPEPAASGDNSGDVPFELPTEIEVRPGELDELDEPAGSAGSADPAESAQPVGSGAESAD